MAERYGPDGEAQGHRLRDVAKQALRTYAAWWERTVNGNWGIVLFGGGIALWTLILFGHLPS